MTYAQWLFEYYALAEKERGWAKRISETVQGLVRSLREVFIGLLGLNLIREWRAPKDKPFDDETKVALADVTPFVPASFLFGRPEQVRPFLDEMQKSDRENMMSTAHRAEQDAAFEAFSARLAAGEVGDMDPVLVGRPGDDVNTYWRSADAQQALRSLGVKPRVGGALVPHIDAKPKVPHALRGVTIDIDDDDETGSQEGRRG